jgi:hypothetical protein
LQDEITHATDIVSHHQGWAETNHPTTNGFTNNEITKFKTDTTPISLPHAPSNHDATKLSSHVEADSKPGNYMPSNGSLG